ncbi:DUF6928 family protein [Nakamurella deserti]|uniref:DUF6928 family protein n=1 Tax=Nakamurella deserti TaxID=2164074 RepID=UPI000DBE7B3C|nr:hypothetical protein [Nakamurella deserti]
MAKIEILGLAAGLPRTELVPGTGGDPSVARDLLTRLFPGRIGAPLPPADLLTASYPEYGRIYAGVFGRTAVVCGQDLLELTDLTAALATVGAGRTAVRLQVNSVADSTALEILGPDGDTARELMLVAEQGVIVDEGARLDFEQPFWAGDEDPEGAFAVVNGAGMPFDVIDFGQEALRTLFGFVVDQDRRPGDLDARRILLHGFVIAADADDPADMAAARSGGDVPELPADVAPDPGGPRSRLRPPADGDTTDLGGGGSGGSGAAPGPDGSADSRAGGSWWARLLDRLFG